MYRYGSWRFFHFDPESDPEGEAPEEVRLQQDCVFIMLVCSYVLLHLLP